MSITTDAPIVDSMPSRGRPPMYPWDEWTDGQKRSLEQGVHFKSKPECFRAHAHRIAKNRGLKVETRIRNNRIYIRFFTPGGAAVATA